jgi:hypothetical protein
MGRRAALTAVLSTLITLLVASSASAVWTHKGKGELKENASVTLKGTLTLSSSAGNVACATEIGTTLTASSSSGHVNSFTVAKPSECDLTGSLATLSLDKTTAFSTATFSGTQTLYNAAGEALGSGELKGTLSAAPSGTYGVKTAASVETRWTDANANLGSDGKLTLSGTFSFSGSGGSISCPATIKLLLESSTVEEEEAEGEVESFTVSKASECDLGGNYQATCGTNAVAKVQQTGTATLNATSEDITVNGLVLDYELEKCAIASLKIEGSPTISVTSPESISSASFSAGALEVFNSKGETLGTATAGGSASASPAGTFQLVAVPPSPPETYWTTTGGTVGSQGEGMAVYAEGEITSFAAGFSMKSTIRLEGEAWNDEESETGVGQVFGEAIGHGTVVGLPTALCTINVTLPDQPWSLALTKDEEEGATTEDATLDVEGFKFVYHLSHGCQTAGTTSSFGVTGTLTATAETDEDHLNLDLASTQPLYVYNTGTGEHLSKEFHYNLSSNPDPLVLQTVDPEGSIGVEQP